MTVLLFQVSPRKGESQGRKNDSGKNEMGEERERWSEKHTFPDDDVLVMKKASRLN